MSWLGRQKNGPARRSGVVTILDVGSSKVCCMIARLKPVGEGQLLRGRTHQAQVIGIGHQKSRGVKSGVVVDLDKAEQAIRLAVDAAERMAGLTVDSLIVNVTAGRLKSETFAASINLGGHEVDAADIKRVLAAGAKQALKAEREVVHSLPTGFSLDGERGIRDPRGMVGSQLGVDMHVLTGDAAPLRNLELCVNRAHLSVERMVATPYASGLAALVDDELEMGAACIDMGGGTTTISVFCGRQVRLCRRHSGRRQPCHDGSGARTVDAARKRRAAEGHARLGLARQRRRPRRGQRPADRRRRHATCRCRCRARR